MYIHMCIYVDMYIYIHLCIYIYMFFLRRALWREPDAPRKRRAPTGRFIRPDCLSPAHPSHDYNYSLYYSILY